MIFKLNLLVFVQVKKMYEELLNENEIHPEQVYEKIYRGKVRNFSKDEVEAIINDLVKDFKKEKIIKIAND